MTKAVMGQDVLAMGYGIIPKMVMKDQDLTIEAKAIYAYIASYAGRGNVAFPSVDLICYDLKIGKERFQKHKKMLLEKGYLVIDQVMAGGKFGRNRYTMNQIVGEVEEASDKEEPMPAFTASEDQSLGDVIAEEPASNSNSVNNNSLKDLLDDDDDSKLNLTSAREQDNFVYWQEKWLRHFGEGSPFTRQIADGLEQWVRCFGDPAVVAHAFVRAGRYGGRSYAYLDSILREWWQEGVRTIEEVYDREIAAWG